MLSEKPWKLRQVMVFLLVAIAGFFWFAGAGGLVLGWAGQKEPDQGSLLFLVLSTLSIAGPILLGALFISWWYQLGWGQMFGFGVGGRVRAIVLGCLATVVFLPAGLLLQGVVHKLLEFRAIHKLLEFFKLKATTEPAIVSLQQAVELDSRLYFALYSVILAPLAEEILFRGVLYPSIKQAGYPKVALIGTSLLFASIHQSLEAFLPLCLLAMILVWLYEQTNNLLAPITAHALFNGLNLVFYYLGWAK